ncbi:MAG: 50S ribosomal protein L15 [Eubacteriaceae bacterium]|nr:50S ribosomal protein L15 [Eubacteriaceae bacterium]
MRLHTLKAPEGSTRKSVRRGRGTASGQGKTAGRGQTGQNSRSGGGVRMGFEGGQMPLTRRVPMRGFSNYHFKKLSAGVALEKLNVFEAGTVVTVEALKAKGIVKNKFDFVKVLCTGEIEKPLTLKGISCSKTAAEKIVSAGGKVEE